MTVTNAAPPAAVAVSSPVRKTRRRRTLRQREALAAYLCLLPWLIGLLVFTAYPLVASLYYAFTDYSILSSPKWAGLQNFRQMFKDPLFFTSLRVTAEYCGVVVPGTVIIGYMMALLLNHRLPLLRLWRTIYFLPSMVPAIAGAFLWSWIFNSQYGVANGLLGDLGITGPQWFGSETWVLPAFMIMTLWGAGSGLVLYLAALQQVPSALYEAAQIDGAGPLRRLVHITLPMTSPVILFTVVTGIISSFQIFTAALVITKGGPNNGSLFYILNLYNSGWVNFQEGYASALAWVLVLIMVALTLVAFLIARKTVFYNSNGGR
ncbi:MAG TPA: sugar ABC transporter permease [Acidobacteriaceae bacterium]|nr:sugar ABC transporter permease [Acidobacteriaceae bacterium]